MNFYVEVISYLLIFLNKVVDSEGSSAITQTGVPIQITFEDRKQFPAYSATAYRLIGDWYQYILQTLELNGRSDYIELLHIPIFYPNELPGEFTIGETTTGAISFSSKFIKDPATSSIARTVVHELTHAIAQHNIDTLEWIYEAIASWIESFHFGKLSLGRPEYTPSGYLAGYSGAAYLLEWIRQRQNCRMCHRLIPELVHACRLHPLNPNAYSGDAFWIRIAGKGVEELWIEMFWSDQVLAPVEWNTPEPISPNDIPPLVDEYLSSISIISRMKKWRRNRHSRAAAKVPRIKIGSTPPALRSFARIVKRDLNIYLPLISSRLSFKRRPMKQIKIEFTPKMCSPALERFESFGDELTSQLSICSNYFEGYPNELNRPTARIDITIAVVRLMLRKVASESQCTFQTTWLVYGLAAWASSYHISRGVNLKLNTLTKFQGSRFPRSQFLITSYFIEWIIETFSDASELPASLAATLFTDGCPYEEKIWTEFTGGRSIEECWSAMMEAVVNKVG